MRACDVMSTTIVTCTPDTPIAQVARIMRDRNLGDILVTEDGQVRGIVTDRDLAVRSTAKGRDPQKVPISDAMTKRVITGQPDWTANKLADTMAKHQIRRLPIVEKGQLVGIVSLGDLATQNAPRPKVAKSLKEISQPPGVHLVRSRIPSALSLMLAVSLGIGAMALLATKAGSAIVARLEDSPTGSMVMNLLNRA